MLKFIRRYIATFIANIALALQSAERPQAQLIPIRVAQHAKRRDRR